MKHTTISRLAAAWFALASLAAQAAPPVVAPGQQFTLGENLPAGTVIGTVQASDADGDPVHLFLIGEDPDQGNLNPPPFAIEPLTRVLRTTAPLNREHQKSWKLRIAATDGSSGVDPQFSDLVTVSVTDVADEPIITPGDAAFGSAPKYIGSEKSITFAPANQGTQPENRPVYFLLQLPPGAVYLGTSAEQGWRCGYATHAVTCRRDGIGVGESPAFTVHLLAPSTPGSANFTTAITAEDYVHVDGRVNTFEVLTHPSPANLAVAVTPDLPSAPVTAGFHYLVDVSDASSPALPAMGLVKVGIDLDSRWSNVTTTGTDPGWSCEVATALVTCERPTLARGSAAPPIHVNLMSPAHQGMLAFDAAVSSDSDEDNSDNVQRTLLAVHHPPAFDNQTVFLAVGSPIGTTFGPAVAFDDDFPPGGTLRFRRTNMAEPAPFSIQSNGTLILTGPVTAGSTYPMSAMVTDGGGLSDDAIVTVSVQAPFGCVSQVDTDGDGICDDLDTDDDNDGVDDTGDNCPLVVNPDQLDTDGDGLGNACDPDDDNDGTPDGTDPCPLDPLNGCTCSGNGGDTDGDGICNDTDPDDDGDAIPDVDDPCPLDPANQCCGAQGNQPCTDDDGDGVPNVDDNCIATPNASQTDTDGDGIGDACDDDDDGDGTPDDEDACPLDPANACTCSVANPDTDGDGLCNSADDDDDGDGVPDASDPCPLDPQDACACSAGDPDTDGDGACNSTDGDDDGDGLPDATDPCPLDPINRCCGPQADEPCDITGMGDDDLDGVPNAQDNCPAVFNPGQEDNDGDGLGDACDGDDDNDGVPDTDDACPLDATNQCVCSVENPDTDGDGQCDASDPDDDNDGIPDGTDFCPLDAVNLCDGRVFQDGFEQR